MYKLQACTHQAIWHVLITGLYTLIYPACTNYRLVHIKLSGMYKLQACTHQSILHVKITGLCISSHPACTNYSPVQIKLSDYRPVHSKLSGIYKLQACTHQAIWHVQTNYRPCKKVLRKKTGSILTLFIVLLLMSENFKTMLISSKFLKFYILKCICNGNKTLK